MNEMLTSMTKLLEVKSSVAERHRKRLHHMRSSGPAAIGIAASLDYCVEHRIDISQELARETLELLCDLLRRERAPKKGRGGGSIARYRALLVHLIRWNEVIVLLDKKAQLEGDIEFEKRSETPDKNYLASLKMKLWFVSNYRRILEAAEVALKDTFAFGGLDAIHKSYRKIERDRSLNVHFLDYSILKKLGLLDTLGPSRFNQDLAWYDPSIDSKASASTRPRWLGKVGPRIRPDDL